MAKNLVGWENLYPYVNGANVHEASKWYEDYLDELKGSNPYSMEAVLNLLKLLDQATDVVVDLLSEADKKGHELERYGHREDCPLRGMGHRTNVLTADGKDKISIIQNIDRKTGKLADLEFRNVKRDDSDRINFWYCPICGGYLYERKDDKHEH